MAVEFRHDFAVHTDNAISSTLDTCLRKGIVLTTSTLYLGTAVCLNSWHGFTTSTVWRQCAQRGPSVQALALPLQPTHSGSGSNPAAGTLYNKDLVWLNLFNAALSRKRYWRGLESQEARDYAQHYSCIQMGSDENHFNVS